MSAFYPRLRTLREIFESTRRCRFEWATGEVSHVLVQPQAGGWMPPTWYLMRDVGVSVRSVTEPYSPLSHLARQQRLRARFRFVGTRTNINEAMILSGAPVRLTPVYVEEVDLP